MIPIIRASIILKYTKVLRVVLEVILLALMVYTTLFLIVDYKYYPDKLGERAGKYMKAYDANKK